MNNQAKNISGSLLKKDIERPRQSTNVSALFDAARKITALEVAERYAHVVPSRLGRKAVCRCPFSDHEDRHPSFTFTSDGIYAGRFICSCGRKGNSIDFVSEYLNIKPYDAAALICKDFGLKVDADVSAEVLRKRDEVKNIRQDLRKSASFANAVNCGMIRWVNDRLDELSGESDANDNAIEELLSMRIDAEYLVDAIFQIADDESKMLALMESTNRATKEKYLFLETWDKAQNTNYVSGVSGVVL